MHTKTPFLIFLIGFVSCVIAEEDLDTYRLPPHYVDHYDIDLTIPAASFTAESNDYEGSVEIKFQVAINNTNEVKLHASSNIQPTNITILENGVDLLIANYSMDSATDILTIQTEKELILSTDYTLRINFKAELLKSEGFYKVSYIDDKNETQFIAVTQFEATHARKAFPCFDEPVYKATFAYSLTYPSDMSALTNTPRSKNKTDETTNLTTTTFEISPRMPVYLVAFVISKYTCDEGTLDEKLEVNHYVCSREDKKQAREFAMTVTPKVIEHLDSYTGIRYADTLRKLDQVAVAEKGGAMENWGLVLYGESSLLFDKTLQTNSNKQNIAAIISHELAHQWFGNLVTCKWWSEVFLNEGFATLFEFYTTANVFPEYEMEEQFVIKVLQPMLVGDASLGIQSLASNASTPKEISSKFGSVSYSKGGSVLRMIEHVLGRNNFKAGIQKYLADNKYGSAEPQDLWNALTIENDIKIFPGETSLSEVVENWISKPGYPLLTVTLNNGVIAISQERFLLSENEEEKSTWCVPVSYTTSEHNDNNENTSPKGWVTPTTNYEITDFTNSSVWIVVNNQQTGYYRVNYDDTLWNNLATALKQANFSGIHVSNRAQIVEDSFNLAKAGLLSFERVLKNVEFLANDDSYLPWYPAVNLFWYLLGKTGTSTKLGAAIAKQFLDLSKTVAESVPLSEVDDEKHIQTLKQVLINNYVCQLGNDKCKSDVTELFTKYKTDGSRPDINIRSIVYCNAIRYSENPKEDWDFLWKEYQNSSESTDKSAIWSALGCATDTAVLNSFLSKILEDDENITSNQYTLIFYAVYNSNEIGVDTALDYFIENYDAIYKKLTSLNFTVSSILSGLGSAFTKTSQIEKLEKFITTIKDSNVLDYATSALKIAKNNQEIIEKHKNDLYEYYELPEDENDDGDTTITTTSQPEDDTPNTIPTSEPTEPTDKPDGGPTTIPTDKPDGGPTTIPTSKPNDPTDKPDGDPTTIPENDDGDTTITTTSQPEDDTPNTIPTSEPTEPTDKPDGGPTTIPTDKPDGGPTTIPTSKPNDPTDKPDGGPTTIPTSKPNDPTDKPDGGPTTIPTSESTEPTDTSTTSKPENNGGGATIKKCGLVGLILVTLLNTVYFKL